MGGKRGGNEPFGNKSGHDLEIEDDDMLSHYSNEPLVEVRDRGSEIDILLEANGSKAEDVVLERINSTSVNISLIYRGRKIRRKVSLPSRAKVKSYLINVKNGVARIKLITE